MKMDYKATYCQQVIDSAMAGLTQGGMTKMECRKFYALFEKIYTAGFNEANKLTQLKIVDEYTPETFIVTAPSKDYSGPLPFTG